MLRAPNTAAALQDKADALQDKRNAVESWTDTELWDWLSRFYYVEVLEKKHWKGTGGKEMIEFCETGGSDNYKGLRETLKVPQNLVYRLLKDFKKLLLRDGEKKLLKP